MSRRLITVSLGAVMALGSVVTAMPSASATPASLTAGATSTQSAQVAVAARQAAPASSPRAVPRTPRAPKAAVNPPMLRPGSMGAAVTTLQGRLASLGYWVGAPTGRYDHATAQAVMAVQKVAGLGRDGVAGPATRGVIDRGVRPKARSTSGRVVEIDLNRQLLMFVVNGKVRLAVNTSTGAKATPTPRGTYRMFRQVNRWDKAPLGELYRPKYFFRGYAVHGVRDGSIPGTPASHGCARVSMKAMDMLWGPNGIRMGDRVQVY